MSDWFNGDKNGNSIHDLLLERKKLLKTMISTIENFINSFEAMDIREWLGNIDHYRFLRDNSFEFYSEFSIFVEKIIIGHPEYVEVINSLSQELEPHFEILMEEFRDFESNHSNVNEKGIMEEQNENFQKILMKNREELVRLQNEYQNSLNELKEIETKEIELKNTYEQTQKKLQEVIKKEESMKSSKANVSKMKEEREEMDKQIEYMAKVKSMVTRLMANDHDFKLLEDKEPKSEEESEEENPDDYISHLRESLKAPFN